MELDIFVVLVFAHQIEELSESAFGSEVTPGYHSGVLEGLAGGVKIHIHFSAEALGDVQDDFALGAGLPDDVQEPLSRKGIARAVGFENDSPDAGVQKHMAGDVVGDSGMDLQDGDARVQGSLDRKGLLRSEVDAVVVVFESVKLISKS